MWDEVRYWLGSGIRRRLRRQVQMLLKAAETCELRQYYTRNRLLQLNAGSQFFRDHQLHRVRNLHEFRVALPISGYSRFEPYIERLKQGEHAALLGPRNSLVMFALSSGTTASSKFIPVTRQFYRDYRRGWQLWGIQAFDAHPTLHRSHILQIASDFDKFRTLGGTPTGNISGFAQYNQNPIVRQMYAIPNAVLKIPDPFLKLYATLRFGLADRKIGLLMSANPSTLVQLAQLMKSHAERLIKDIHDGTYSPGHGVESQTQSLLNPLLMANRQRAGELEQAIDRNGTLTPLSAWPNLALLAVWTGGSVAAYLPQLKQFYGDIPIRDHGLSASEGRMTIPVSDETSSGLLDIESHYFEFVPEAEIDAESPTVLEAHELQAGGRYFILLTTSSGLYRYDIHDVVECTGFIGTTPLIRFLHKGAHISSITGEKLSESQVVDAVTRVATLSSHTLGQFVLSPRWGDPPGYVLWLEDGDGFPPDAGHFCTLIDRELQSLNSEYAEKRQSNRLKSLDVKTVPAGTWTRWARQRQSGPGGSAEQYKHPFLVPRLEFEQEISPFLSTG